MDTSFALILLLLLLVLLLLLAAGLISGIILWLRGGWSRGDGQMACGSCAYPVNGLSALNCPECGADLREVGINPSKSSGKRTLGIILTLLCGFTLLAMFLVTLLFVSVPV